MLSPLTPHRAIGETCAIALPELITEVLLSPDQLRALVIHDPALAAQQAVRHPPELEEVFNFKLTKPKQQLSLLKRKDSCWIGLGAERIGHTQDRPYTITRVTLMQDLNGLPEPIRDQMIHAATTLSFASGVQHRSKSLMMRKSSFN